MSNLRFSGRFLLLCLTAVVTLHASLDTDPNVLNFGVVKPHTRLEGKITLINTGPQELEIKEVTTDCACAGGPKLTALPAHPEKTHLAPGESTVLPVSFDTTAFQGHVSHLLFIPTTAGTRAIRLEMTVSSYAHWLVVPMPGVLPASMVKSEATGRITLKPLGGSGNKALAVRSETPWLEARLEPTSPVEAQVVVLRKRPEAPVGEHAVTLTVDTGDPAEPQLTVPITVTVGSPVRLQPDPLILPATSPGQEASLTFQVSNWPGPNPPTIKLDRGTVALKDFNQGTGVYKLTVPAGAPGVLLQKLSFYDGTDLLLEGRMILRVTRPAKDAEGK